MFLTVFYNHPSPSEKQCSSHPDGGSRVTSWIKDAYAPLMHFSHDIKQKISCVLKKHVLKSASQQHPAVMHCVREPDEHHNDLHRITTNVTNWSLCCCSQCWCPARAWPLAISNSEARYTHWLHFNSSHAKHRVLKPQTQLDTQQSACCNSECKFSARRPTNIPEVDQNNTAADPGHKRTLLTSWASLRCGRQYLSKSALVLFFLQQDVRAYNLKQMLVSNSWNFEAWLQILPMAALCYGLAHQLHAYRWLSSRLNIFGEQGTEKKASKRWHTSLCHL